MCTVTWLPTDGGYELLCSRDELRTRGPASPPRRHPGPPVYLAPIDSDGGGTWVAVNEHGVGLALLNDYEADRGIGEFESRGRLVVRLTASSSAPDALGRLAAIDLGRYCPFRLVILAPGEVARIHHWDGRRAVDERPSAPPLLTSSSFDPAAADRSRRELLGRLSSERPTLSELAAFHRSHEPERGPLSPCMHRPDARTVSFTRVSVSAGEAVMSYLEGPPCVSDAASVAGEDPRQALCVPLQVRAPAGA